MKASVTFRNEEKAPASEGGRYKGNEKKKAPNRSSGPFLILSRRRPTFPHSYPCSIIGPARLNFRVRDGNGCDPRGMTTGNTKLAYRFPMLIPGTRMRVRQQNLAGITSSTRGRTPLCRKGVYCDSCESHLLFLKDGLRKFYD